MRSGEDRTQSRDRDKSVELVVLARDAGDQAINSWFDDQLELRFEIEVVDVARDNNKAWLYLFHSSSELEKASGYLNYDSVNDTVFSDYYKISFNSTGLPNYFAISTNNGGDGQDLLDRMKLRVRVDLGFLGSETLTENNLTRLGVQFTEDPKVRLIRNVRTKISINKYGQNFSSEGEFPFFYYPFNQIMNAEMKLIKISPNGITGRINLLRASIDLNESAMTDTLWNGMAFYNPHNRDLPELSGRINVINGSGGYNINKASLSADNFTWNLITGMQGTLLTQMWVPILGNLQLLYFWDRSQNNSTWEVDGTDDTGDRKSFGDTGLLIIGSDILGSFKMLFNTFFLPAYQTVELGDQFLLNTQNPLVVIVREQTFSVPVELSEFTANEINGAVELNWETVSEKNNYGFDVERRKGNDEYKKIFFMPGAGTTNQHQVYSYLDKDVTSGYYYYRLKQLDMNGSSVFHAEIQLTIAPPLEFALHQNFPNPFNPTTTLAYDLAADVPVKLVIYNTKGQVVNIVVNGKKAAGRYQVLIDGSLWPSGIYFVRLTAGKFSFVKKIILLE